MRLFYSASAAAVSIAAMLSAAHGQTVSVSNAAEFQNALNSVPEGGIIEMAAGTYAAPEGGFTVFPRHPDSSVAGFTVRPAGNGEVVLTGGGSSGALFLATPRLVRFERLTFRNGSSITNFRGGAVTLADAQAAFTDCNFDGNSAVGPTTGGGAVWIATSTASFYRCTWTNNTTNHYGAGISAFGSRLFVRDSSFVGNRSNLPGHSDFSTGGGIHADSSTVHVANSRFENNQAGYVGGAIYAIGPWKEPYSTPVTDLLVTDCLFTGNSAVREANGRFTAPTTGGAIMMEDQVRARIFNSRFQDNVANQGGALSSYRTTTDVQNCTFQSNRAVVEFGQSRLPDQHGYGGTIIVLSDDNADKSTAGGTINRPVGKLTVTDSMIRGNGTPVARQGGGVFVAGDLHSAFGVGVPQNGSLDSNRAVATFRRVAFFDLVTADTLANNGTGGALTGDFANVTIEDSIIANCKTSQNGGGVDFAFLSVAALKRNAFTGNEAANLGGAVASFGGELTVDGCSFAKNKAVADGGYGSALMTVDGAAGRGAPVSQVTGTVRGSIFSSNAGLFAIYDGRNPGGPVNATQYTNNRFFEGATPFYTDDGGPKTVAQLDALSIAGIGKSGGGNTVEATAPLTGALLMIPPAILGTGAPGESLPHASSLAYAGDGGALSLNGSGRPDSAGVITTAGGGAHTLNVGSSSFRTAPRPGNAANISTRLNVKPGSDALFGGFIIVGSAPKRVIVRAIGPSLAFGGVLQDPQLELFSGDGTPIGSNDNWRTTVVGGAITTPQSVDIVASTIPPADDREPAIVATLEPGAYTAVVRGAGGGSGVGLVEVYDLDAVPNATLANISTRGSIEPDPNAMIGGFIYLGGPGATKVVIRAIGPSLSQLLPNALVDPTLELVDANGEKNATNDDWAQSPDAATLRADKLEPRDAREAALVVTGLRAGAAYTAIVRGKNGTAGVGLVEAYIYQ